MQPKIDEDRCLHLRWKGLLIDSRPQKDAPSDGAFWCQKTHVCLGPDAKVVDQYECNETRKCYEAL